MLRNTLGDLLFIEGNRALHNKWVLRVKEETNGKNIFKAMLWQMAKDFQKVHILDYSEVFINETVESVWKMGEIK